MNLAVDPRPSQPPKDRNGRAWRGLWIALGLLILIGGPVEQLLLGWLYFPIRVLPRVTLDPPAVALGGISFVALAVGLHWALSKSIGSLWTLRMTAAAMTTVVVSFAAGIAMVGAAHQVVWLSTGRADSGNAEARSQLWIPSIGRLVSWARRDASRSHLRNVTKQLALALDGVSSVHVAWPPGGTMRQDGTLLHGWPIYLSGFASYAGPDVDLSIPWDAPANDRYFRCGLRELINPLISGPLFDKHGHGLCHFAANYRVMPMRIIPEEEKPTFYPTGRSGERSPAKDGDANTILIGSAAGDFRPWGHPANLRDPADGINQTSTGFGGLPGAAYFAMCDGSVKTISEKVDRKILEALATPDGQEPVPDF